MGAVAPEAQTSSLSRGKMLHSKTWPDLKSAERAPAAHGSFKIRKAEVSDVQSLSELEEVMWPRPLRGLSADSIAERIARFPSGQLVLLDPEDRIIGSLYTQRINSVAALQGRNFHSAIDLFAHNGPLLQLVSIQIQSRYQPGLAHLLLQRAFAAAKAEGIEVVVAVTRCREYREAQGRSPSLDMLHYATHGFCFGNEKLRRSHATQNHEPHSSREPKVVRKPQS